MALGAQRRDILTNVLVEGFVIACIGVLAGAVVAFAFASAIGKYVAGVQLPGALAFIGSAVVLLAAAVIASAVPAARAASVNAVETLRSQ
jgi:ABC-type antimicrobial peptide transport system permease subunit